MTEGQGSRPAAIVSGFVLKLARRSTGLSQEQLAEALAVSVATIQGWESGRRPLAAMNTGDFLRLSSLLPRLGAPATTGRHLTEAIAADQVLAAVISSGPRGADAATHPLGASVHRRSLTNLITWPITKLAPPQLRDFTPTVPGRGPVPHHPFLPAEDRARFFDRLVSMAETETRPDAVALASAGFPSRIHDSSTR